MNEIEIATGAAMAAHSAACNAWRRNVDEQRIFVEGSRARTCVNANSPLLHEAVALLEKASRLLDEARERQARMLGA